MVQALNNNMMPSNAGPPATAPSNNNGMLSAANAGPPATAPPNSNGMLSATTAGQKRRADHRVAVPRQLSTKSGFLRQPSQSIATSSPSPVSTQDPQSAAVDGTDANKVTGQLNGLQLNSLQLNGQANTFEPQTSQGPYLKALLENSQPEHPAPVIVNSNGGQGSAITKSQSPIGTRPEGTGRAVSAKFSSDPGPQFLGGHYVQITGFIDREDLNDGINQVLQFPDKSADELDIFDRKLALPDGNSTTPTPGVPTALIAFNDIGHAGLFIERLDVVKSTWKVVWVNHSEYDLFCDSITRAPSRASPYEGQVLIIARPSIATNKLKQDVRILSQEIMKLAANYGNILAFDEVPQGNSGELHFHLEYRKFSQARKLLQNVSEMTPDVVGNHYVISLPFDNMPLTEPDDDRYYPSPHGNTIMSPNGRTWVGPNKEFNNQKPMQGMADGVFGGELPTYQTDTSFVVYRQGNGLPPQPLPHQGFGFRGPPPPGWQGFNGPPQPQGWQGYAGHQGQGHHGFNTGRRHMRTPLHNIHGRPNSRNHGRDNIAQFIDLEKVLNGQDVRTTLMIRDIPNHWTCHEFKALLDAICFGRIEESHEFKALLDAICFGRYDFSYLRIDFSKSTNVGYGFVNFSDAEDIAHLLRSMQGVQFEAGHRNFAASYATVQGLDCLIEKFRNSSVMSEQSDFRPHLWYTENDAPTEDDIGREKQFPGPNNWSKTQRSHDNAGTIGLFPPRSAQRAYQSHRSQYDRGTQHQLREDAWFGNDAGYTTASGPGYYLAPQWFPAPVPVPMGMQCYQPSFQAGDMVPRAFSGAATGQAGPAAAPRGGVVGRGPAEMYRY